MVDEISIIMADDHYIFRDGFKLLLNNVQGLKMVGEAENGRQLIDMTEALRPDLVFTDIKMPVMDGIEACKTICEKHPEIGVIALSMFNDDHLIMEMLEAGAKGYLLKNTTKEELLAAAKTVYNNGKYFCNSTSMKLAKLIAESRFNPYKKNNWHVLSDRETEIVRLICEQCSNKEIAERLYLSIRTVESHREKIFEKINAKNIVGVVLYAIRHGIIRVE